jgi:hypothetical protein
VNSLLTTGARQANIAQRPQRRRNGDNPMRNSLIHSNPHTDKPAKENPNMIPLPQKRVPEEGENKGAEKQRRLGLEDRETNWGETDEEQYLADRIKGWS